MWIQHRGKSSGSSLSEQECFDAVTNEWESQAFHMGRSRGRPQDREGHQPQSELQETGWQVIPPASGSGVCQQGQLWPGVWDHGCGDERRQRISHGF